MTGEQTERRCVRAGPLSCVAARVDTLSVDRIERRAGRRLCRRVPGDLRPGGRGRKCPLHAAAPGGSFRHDIAPPPGDPAPRGFRCRGGRGPKFGRTSVVDLGDARNGGRRRRDHDHPGHAQRTPAVLAVIDIVVAAAALVAAARREPHPHGHHTQTRQPYDLSGTVVLGAKLRRLRRSPLR